MNKLIKDFEDGYVDSKKNAIYCEKIASDFAIKFAEWAANKYLKLYSVWVPHYCDQRKKENWKTTEQLLEIFKKEYY